MHTPTQDRGHDPMANDLDVVTAAHDLRNRLGIAGCELQQLQRRLATHADADRAEVALRLASVEQSLAATNALLEGFLETACEWASAQLAAGEAEPLDLVAWAKRIIEAAPDSERVSLQTSVQRLVGTWDEARLTIVLRSLLGNALQYSPAGGEVVVTIDCLADDVIISVADDGIGIPAADLSHVCEPFFRARNAERVAPGLGLGLATARRILEQYGGWLDVDSAEGVGTMVTARLPLLAV